MHALVYLGMFEILKKLVKMMHKKNKALENLYNPAWSRDHPGLKFHTIPGATTIFFFIAASNSLGCYPLHSGQYDPILVQ